jgi:MoaA/NifB/PqqE/SkfB family radical SAM enzyme
MVEAEHISLEIELSTRCTIGCCACPRHRDWKNKEIWNSGFINLDVIKSVLDNTNYRSYNFVGAYGDSIYHPNFHEIMEYALGLGKKFMVETNGAHRDEKFWNKLAEMDWDIQKHRWHFSIDGLQDTNHIYRKNSKWDSIMYAVQALHNAPSRPYLSWKYIVFPYNEHQISTAEALAKELGFDDFRPVKSLRNYNPGLFENDDEQKQIDWNFSQVS